MTLVLCHGCFDILHIGHFRHFRQARTFGDRLVVSITAARYVNKGPGHPAHDDAERLEQLRDLRVVDEAYLCEDPTGAPAILKYRPQVYAKGIDYSVRGVCTAEVIACRDVGAEIKYTGTDKRSVAELVAKFSTERRQA